MIEPDWRHLVRRYHVSSTGPPGYPAGDLNHLPPEHSTVFGERFAPADGLHVTVPSSMVTNTVPSRPRECCPATGKAVPTIHSSSPSLTTSTVGGMLEPGQT